MMVGGRAEQVMGKHEGTSVLAVLVGMAIVLHVSAAAALVPLARWFEKRATAAANNVSVVEFEAQREPEPAREPDPPPPQPEPQQQPPEPQPEPERPRPVVRRERAPEPPPRQAERPPEPTRAAPVLVAQEFSNEPDPNNVVAVGDNANASGDVSNTGVVRGPGQGVQHAQIGGAVNGHGRGPVQPQQAVAPAVDYSHRAELECDENAVHDMFPDAAREAGVDRVLVRVSVAVDASGHIVRVRALNDPGYGAPSVAERVVRNYCRVTPARDREGHAVADTIPSFRVEFVSE